MNIIPILPAPQQGTMPHPAELPTGTDGTGFAEMLRRGLPAAAPRSHSPGNTTIPAGRHKPDLSNPETPPAITGSDTSQTPDSALSEMDEDITLAAEVLPVSALLDPVESSVEQFFPANELGFLFNRPLPNFSAPFTGRVSGLFTDSIPVSPHFSVLLPSADQTLQPAEQNRSNIFAGPTAQNPEFLQPAAIEPNQLSAEPPGDIGISQKITLELQSNASPFSINTAEAVHVTAERLIIEADFISARHPINLANQHLNAFESRAAHSAKPVAAFLQSHGSSIFNTMPVEKGVFFFESTTVSFSLPGQAEPAPAVQTAAAMQQPTLMLNELHKLIGHNNDRLTITATLERASTPGTANHEALLKAVQEKSNLVLENPEQQRSATENLFRMNSGHSPAAALNTLETAPQTRPEHLRSEMMEGFREQFFGPRSASAEQGTRSGVDQQMLQQHPNSADGSQQQQASDTTAARSVLSADQATVSPVFSSQFHDGASAQSAETAKMVSPASAHLNLVRDQEIIKQIVDRFALYSQKQTSRLSLQLHPAELGKLKIDLIVKGDVLKANIYTQTQQAGEIIDRNLTRLREILQDQGITVDELAVSLKSDSKDDFTPQHGQLFEEQNPLYKGQQRVASASTFAQTIEDALLTETTEPSGVNLTI